jgi:hypothetical protein
LSLSYSAIHIEQRDEKRRIIIGAPLLLVAVFCFGLLMIHPARSTEAGTPSSASAAHKKTPSVNTAPAAGFTRLPLIKTDLTTLSPVKTAEAGSIGGSTESPQSAADTSSDGTSSGYQPASSNGSSGKLPVTSAQDGSDKSLLRPLIKSVLNGL